CPRERAEAQDAAAAAAASASGSLAGTPLSTPLRKQVSWSPGGPQVFLVPGSREQRGTDLQEALRGREPFFRPAKAQGASFIIQAQLDPTDCDAMHLQLLPASTCSRAPQLLLAAAAAAAASSGPGAASGGAAAAGTPPLLMSPVPMSPVLATILSSSPRSSGSPLRASGSALGSGRVGGSSGGSSGPTRLTGSSSSGGGAGGGGGGAAAVGPFLERGLSLGRLDVGLAWRGGAVREQARRVKAAAQLVMDCTADLMTAPEGVRHAMDMLAGGLELAEAPPSSTASGDGKVRLLLRGRYPAGVLSVEAAARLVKADDDHEPPASASVAASVATTAAASSP
ncbi:hypothetical protein Agub_g4018, partial [Astrephomene gubernaculifera]